MTDLINDCKTAELHRISRIQGHGALLGVDSPSGLIFACSENVSRFFGKEANELIGHPYSDLFDPDDLPPDTDTNDDDLYVPTITETVLNNQEVVVLSHVRGKTLILEIEYRPDETLYRHSDKLVFLQGLSACTSPEEAAALLLKHIAKITDFDRVMLYKFLPGWHGKVIAEQNKPGVEGFLGLHFPAGDVPENARRLYTMNMQRIIADVSATDIDVITADDKQELDLTYAQLRAVHPVHIQYLQHIGAQASYSVSIVVAGKLWGMVACHHMQTRTLGFRSRNLCEELARIASLHILGLIAVESAKRRSGFFSVKSAIQSALNSGEGLELTINKLARQLLSTFIADGIWLHVDGNDYYGGTAERIEDMELLKSWLGSLDNQQIFHSSNIAADLQSSHSLVRYASGTLFLPFGDRGFLLFCRNEQRENVQWAGRQDECSANTNGVNELTPRKSFQAWTEEVHGQSNYWHEIELESARRLQEILTAYLEKSDLEQMALEDGLTGLANRAQFEQELGKAITVSKARGSIIAVFMLDLDKFKPINDTYGHSAGDDLLTQVGERLTKLVRDRDIVARFGGDEFAIILYHFKDISEVEAVARRMVEEIQRPFRLREAEVQIGASVGIALYPEHADNQQLLIENADLALYSVKRSGRNAYKLFDVSLRTDTQTPK